MNASFVVLDTETTGFMAGKDRVIEIGAVAMDPYGHVEREWSTLLNPERDLGAVHVHHIDAADVLDAPHFGDIAGDLFEFLEGRVVVGHNVSFDARFIESEFQRAGYAVSLPSGQCLCTLRLAREHVDLPDNKLATCCRHYGVTNTEAHSALSDARATAEVFRSMAGAFGGIDQLISCSRSAVGAVPVSGPRISRRAGVQLAQRGQGSRAAIHYLDRLVQSHPHGAVEGHEARYLAHLDTVLLDRVISRREADGLIGHAVELGIGRDTALRLNGEYLNGLAEAALADGVVSEAELHDLELVRELLGLEPDAVTCALEAARRRVFHRPEAPEDANPTERPVGFSLEPGDLVVFTGAGPHPRPVLTEAAEAAGLKPHGGVTKKVRLVVAADPDSLSGKARKAADYGIPIVTQDAFLAMVGR